MKQTLPFTKMHGLGNDYIYVNGFENQVKNPQEVARRLADRRFGVGSDGLVLILPSETSDFQMRMFNADGSESEMCGNAVRCIGKLVYEKGLTRKKLVTLETKAGEKKLELEISGEEVVRVRVDMGPPVFSAAAIPVISTKPEVIDEPVELGGARLRMTCVSMGNPHAVFFVPELTDELVKGLGPIIETDAMFPRRTNVEFVKVLSRTALRMRVWERGSGETLACGTGASAVLAAAVRNGLSERAATIHLLGGDLDIEWQENGSIFKTGPAAYICEGIAYL